MHRLASGPVRARSARREGPLALMLLAAFAFSCSEKPQSNPTTRSPEAHTTERSPEPVSAENVAPQPAPSSEGASGGPSPSPSPSPSAALQSAPPRLPAGVLPGLTVQVPIPGDRPVRVVHAGAGNRRALVYLPGMCGSTHAMDSWAALASHYGTMLILSADLPCEGRPGTRWPKDVTLIQPRIDRALEVVAEARGGQLDTERLVLIGYSQGAHRGEALAARYPQRYPYLILAGSPEAPSPQNLGQASAVAVLGGEREDTSHMRSGERALQNAGLRSEFFLLPRAPHGDYGPEGPAVLGEVFSWLFGA